MVKDTTACRGFECVSNHSNITASTAQTSSSFNYSFVVYLFISLFVLTLANFLMKSDDAAKAQEVEDDNNSDWKDEDTSEEEIE